MYKKRIKTIIRYSAELKDLILFTCHVYRRDGKSKKAHNEIFNFEIFTLLPENPLVVITRHADFSSPVISI